jgi:hypothetical protein
MKLSRFLVATMTLLAAAGSSQALSPLAVDEATVPVPAPKTQAGEDWQNELVVESLKTWQVLCKKGRLSEAEQLAQMLANLQPDNPKVRAACTVTQFFKSLANRMTCDMEGPEVVFTPPVPVPCPPPCAMAECLPAPTCVRPAGCAVQSGCGAAAATKHHPMPCDNLSCDQLQFKFWAGPSCATAGMTLPGPCCLQQLLSGLTPAGTLTPCCGAKACCNAPTTAAKNCCCGKDGNCCCAQTAASDPCRGQAPAHPHVIVIGMPMPHAPMHLPLQPGMVAPPHMVVLPPPMACPVDACQEDESVPTIRRVTRAKVTRVSRDDAAPARLKTPHIEAQCERMSCAGSPERMILEGNVCLRYNKDGQVVHIEAQRVVVNVKEGTFTVEANPAAPAVRVNSVSSSTPTMPTMNLRRSVHVVPVPACPED